MAPRITLHMSLSLHFPFRCLLLEQPFVVANDMMLWSIPRESAKWATNPELLIQYWYMLALIKHPILMTLFVASLIHPGSKAPFLRRLRCARLLHV